MKISIVVPVYNVENELKRCVQSLMEQTYKNLEVILVNDGSKDQSPAICDALKEQDQRIVVIHKENGGLSDARNYGLNQATGDYVLYIDSDDSIELDACERFADIIRAYHPDVIVSEAKEIREGNITYQIHTNLEEHHLYTSREYMMLAMRAKEWYAPACFNCYKRSMLVDHKLQFVKGILHEDIEMLPRVFLSAETVAYMQYPFYNYYIREDSITQSRDYSRNFNSLMAIFEKWKKRYDLVEDKELQRVLYATLSKHFIAACRKYHMLPEKYPEGISKKFLVKYCLDFKEKAKAYMFVLYAKKYIQL